MNEKKDYIDEEEKEIIESYNSDEWVTTAGYEKKRSSEKLPKTVF